MSMNKLLKTMSIHHDKLYFYMLIALSAISLSYAFFVEYVLGFDPCILCLYQRVPYYLLIVTGIGGLVFKRYKLCLYVALAIFFASIFLAGYHTGIEREFFSPSETCNRGFNIPEGASADEIREMLYDAPIATCTRASFKIFGISMTEWNLILNIFMFFGTILVIKKSKQ